jgi:hypothetical protein
MSILFSYKLSYQHLLICGLHWAKAILPVATGDSATTANTMATRQKNRN